MLVLYIKDKVLSCLTANRFIGQKVSNNLTLCPLITLEISRYTLPKKWGEIGHNL